MDDNDTVTTWISTPGARATWRSTYHPHLRPIPGHIVDSAVNRQGLGLRIDWAALRFHDRDADILRFLHAIGIEAGDDTILSLDAPGAVVEPN